MARKKKLDQGKVHLVYVNDFTYHDSEDEESMGGHPFVGRVYRMIQDSSKAYRIYIGEDKNPMKSAGIFVDTLKGDFPRWTYDMEVITEDNYPNFDLHEEDLLMIQEWFKSPSMDLDKYLDPSKSYLDVGKDQKPLSPSELLKLLSGLDRELEGGEERVKEEFTVGDDITISNDTLELALTLEALYEKDGEIYNALAYLIDYVISTYSDKYESAEMPNLSKTILTSTELGKGANIFTAFKYIQRYATTGFEKSGNPIDLLKSIHYVLFELQRTKPWNKPKTIKRNGKK